jgi:hypothetical protein
MRGYSRAWRAANPGKPSALTKAWEERNPEKVRQIQRRRWDRKKGAPVLLPLTADQDRQRRQDFDCTCAFCGKLDPVTGRRPPMDHFLPLSLGNALTLGNAIPACQHCNGSKHNADPWQWYSRQSFFSEKRWNRILEVLGKGDYRQMTLI